ncbi:DUF1858 domain-containing protein [Methanobrevibacter olleyae]|uniref:DUF1858 domain-containing protein n=1 Tax=Methanobrevibacter olleyae TaxID=294671 RepID=A0A126R0P6_METOL|nr:DUF1858 domain-containing protein [Methanobrevibacter olleyae]AMK15634.1 hypothetical protein YLM1_1077 [Methanobrevibacter olleyae]SFL24293.1 protein of unknown function [Methanobrevibacter olleyae]
MIKITSETKLSDILKEYPWLKDELVKISPKFKMLKTPIAKVMMRKVDISKMSKISEIDVNTIITKLNELIESHNNEN